MTNPVVLWLGNLLGIGAGPAIALLTLLCGIGYILGFWLLLELLVTLTVEYKRTSSTIEKLGLLVVLIPVGAVIMVLDIIHTILCIWLGIRALAGLRHYIEHTR